ncbi:BN159_2729 family protein, partial [Streptomyces sp. NPDC057253]|uniref:BN159_2729 family protein n=1 Tax=Streptomyces sp. NPDC057253 TaxID=3346069 RepID=UPI0036420F42
MQVVKEGLPVPGPAGTGSPRRATQGKTSADQYGPAPGPERQARHWNLACARARRTAYALAAAHGAHADVLSVAPQGDEVIMIVCFSDLDAWYALRAAFAIRPDTVAVHEEACVGRGRLDGTPVRLVGRAVPALLEAEESAMTLAYRLWDRVYDLARPQLDCQGHVWEYRGLQGPDGVPLMHRLTDGHERRMTAVARSVGPLCGLPRASDAGPRGLVYGSGPGADEGIASVDDASGDRRRSP